MGIIITMYYQDHNPPHFHARYTGFKAVITIENLILIEGHLPPRVLGLVIEWANLHRNELIENWNRAREFQQLNIINPLE